MGGFLAQCDTILILVDYVCVTLVAHYSQGRYFSSDCPMLYLLLMR